MLDAINTNSNLCACCCRKPDDMHASLEQSQIIGDQKERVVPNSNQDQWIQYVIFNLGAMEDASWVRQLLRSIDQIETEFQTGKYRGAIFHLNFAAMERRRFKTKVSLQKMNSLPHEKPKLTEVNYSSNNFGDTQERKAMTEYDPESMGAAFATKSIIKTSSVIRHSIMNKAAPRDPTIMVESIIENSRMSLHTEDAPDELFSKQAMPDKQDFAR